MKKFIILMVAIFLAFSVSGYSQDRHNKTKTTQSAKISHTSKKTARKGVKPRRSGSRKTMHKPVVKHASRKAPNNFIKL